MLAGAIKLLTSSSKILINVGKILRHNIGQMTYVFSSIHFLLED